MLERAERIQMNTPTSISQRLIPILDTFSAKFHGAFPDEHRIASPLGAWCLLAFIAANDKKAHPDVVKNLGCSADEASEILVALLKEKPDVVALAVQSWIAPSIAGIPSFVQWAKDVADISVTEKTIPTEDELHSWVEKESLGLISKFPVKIVPEEFMALFATVIATDIKWNKPLQVTPSKVMQKAWDASLFLADSEFHNSYIHKDSQLGYFGVHCGTTAEKDLNVYSVIALDESVTEEQTMAVARGIAAGSYNPVAISELEVGESTNGILSVQDHKSSSSEDTFISYLPAWKSSNTFDLIEDVDFGFGHSVARFADHGEESVFTVKQVSVAEYNSVGFKAAALTYGLMARCAAMTSYDVRRVQLKYLRPYAVVASVNSSSRVWSHIPVFDGWITEAVEAEKP
jgi:hypothetical protein